MKKFDIACFVSGADSVCREERQYALYLHNVLLGIKAGKIEDKEEKILRTCGLPANASIERVFYEATFMRDLFEYDRKEHVDCFNNELLRYICDNFQEIPQKEKEQLSAMQENGKGYHLGANAGQGKLKRYPNTQFVARVMMNAKPDIAIIYRKEPDEAAEKYLRFIECKYLSKEEPYKNVPEAFKGTNQVKVQNWVAQFLCCHHCFLNDKKINYESTMLVQFISNWNNKQGKKRMGIDIATLIELNSRLF